LFTNVQQNCHSHVFNRHHYRCQNISRIFRLKLSLISRRSIRSPTDSRSSLICKCTGLEDVDGRRSLGRKTDSVRKRDFSFRYLRDDSEKFWASRPRHMRLTKLNHRRNDRIYIITIYIYIYIYIYISW